MVSASPKLSSSVWMVAMQCRDRGLQHQLLSTLIRSVSSWTFGVQNSRLLQQNMGVSHTICVSNNLWLRICGVSCYQLLSWLCYLSQGMQEYVEIFDKATWNRYNTEIGWTQQNIPTLFLCYISCISVAKLYRPTTSANVKLFHLYQTVLRF